MSAAITTYDRPEEVKRAIGSVLAQTYERLELLIVEDGSDSGTEEWLEAEGVEARYIRHETNRGLAAARNSAIETCRGEFIAFLDDDDEWKPHRIEHVVERLRAIPANQLATFGVIYCGIERRSKGRVLSIGHPKNRGNLRDAIVSQGASTLPSSCLFSKAALEDVGGFDESLSSSIDHDIWMALADGDYDAYTVDEPLVITHTPFEASMMTDTESRIKGVRMFVEKWIPTYQEWFGEEAGREYAQRYFARVIARLAATKIVTGQLDEAQVAVAAIREESDELWYPVSMLMYQIFEAGIKRYLPPWAVRRVSNLAYKLKV